MSKVIVANFSLSIDGYGAGPEQSPDEPLGKGGEELHSWQIGTRAFQEIHGKSGGSEGIDSDHVARFTQGVGSFILGRNMFGPIRGDWRRRLFSLTIRCTINVRACRRVRSRLHGSLE